MASNRGDPNRDLVGYVYPLHQRLACDVRRVHGCAGVTVGNEAPQQIHRFFQIAKVEEPQRRVISGLTNVRKAERERGDESHQGYAARSTENA